MATTFQINKGDVIINNSTGRPKLLGNGIGETDSNKSRKKASQDIRGGLSTDRLASGASAAISELIGLEQDGGFLSAQILLNRQIRDMFSNMLRLQAKRLIIRPDSERFSRISFLQVIRDQSKTGLRFTLDIKTVSGVLIREAGLISA